MRRPRIMAIDRLFWVTLRRMWPKWSDVLLLVKPETVIKWHRAGFRKYWTWLSRRKRTGRLSVSRGLRELILHLPAENPTWGAPSFSRGAMHAGSRRLRAHGFKIPSPATAQSWGS